MHATGDDAVGEAHADHRLAIESLAACSLHLRGLGLVGLGLGLG